MLNLVGEVFQGAEWDRFLWRVNDISVAESMVWDNDLRVAFSTKSSTFKQWFFIPNTLLINKLSGLDIIDCINNKVESGPEVIIEELFVLGANS